MPEPATPERQLTISRLFTPRVTTTTYGEPTVTVPYLRVSGRWLARLGFAPGDRVRVEAERGKLLVTRIQPSEGAG